MNDRIMQEANGYAARRRRRHIWQKIMGVLAAVVVFATTYALILPAITMEKPAAPFRSTRTRRPAGQKSSRPPRPSARWRVCSCTGTRRAALMKTAIPSAANPISWCIRTIPRATTRTAGSGARFRKSKRTPTARAAMRWRRKRTSTMKAAIPWSEAR